MTSRTTGFIRLVMALLVGSALVTSCRGEAGLETDVGDLTMTLATTSPLGVEYRLRNALFRISGPDSMDVSSEDYPPEQTQIAVTLASGDYQVWLLDGWFIEHSANGQPFTPIPADLVSPNPVATTVNADQVTRLTFSFQVDEGLINFGPGTLSIDFDVEEATALTVFVSDAQVSSNIGGIGAADSICQSEAEAAGLKGTFRAWLSDSGYSPASDWGLAGGSYRFVRPDGVLVASSWENLVDDTVTYPLLNSINVKADGTLIPSGDPSVEWTVWTGTRADGSAFPGTNCDGWTSIDNSLDTLIGAAVGTAGDWTELAPITCGDYAYRFYCFEQSYAAGLCDGVDCTSNTLCIEDGVCDPADGMCVAGASFPAGASCDDNGGIVCDGEGNCVECNTNDECGASANQCTASVCLDHQCALVVVPDGDACDLVGIADGECIQGVCVPIPECVVDIDCDDGNVCTLDSCVDSICEHAPNDGASCIGDTGLSGTCNAGVCIEF